MNRNQKMRKETRSILVRRTTGPITLNRSDAGSRPGTYQPPRKNVAARAENMPAVANSPMKNKRNRIPLYSVRYPVTISDSATGMSNGGWVSSAWTATRKMAKPKNCVSRYGLPIPPQPNISPLAWARTISWTLSVPAWMTTPITARTRGSS